jgi:hypothetical protein
MALFATKLLYSKPSGTCDADSEHGNRELPHWHVHSASILLIRCLRK